MSLMARAGVREPDGQVAVVLLSLGSNAIRNCRILGQVVDVKKKI